MDVGIASASVAVGAGLASVLSPCVLPVVPVLVAGASGKDRLRPVLLVAGLSASFMAMGAVSSLLGEYLIGRTRYIELAGSFFILAMGLSVLLDLGVFKRFHRLANIHVGGEGRIGALVLGMSLGLVWVPCVGPFLSTVLAMVGTSGQLARGVALLGLYSLGLAIPMLAIAYASHLVQGRLRGLMRHGALLRYVSGGILVAFGLYSIVFGNPAY
ncbi:MAG TPA: cytochrome c biogenesis CcdA family protein [Candidatus Deferrimicrobiaceae bacterium]